MNHKSISIFKPNFSNIFMSKLRWAVIAIIIVNIAFVLTMPAFRHGDDIRYLIIADSIARTGDLAPQTVDLGVEFYHPPLFIYAMSFLRLLFSDVQAWIFAIKLSVLACFAGSMVLIYDLMKKFNLSETQRAAALLIFSFMPATLAVSTAVMMESLMLFMFLVLIKISFKEEHSKKDYAMMFVLSGLMSLTKYTFALATASVVLSLFVNKSSDRWKTTISIALGAAIIGSWWYVRNMALFGSPIYLGTHAPMFPTNAAELARSLFMAYFTFFSMPNSAKLAVYFPSLGSLIPLASWAFILLSVPIFVLFAVNWKNNWKKYGEISPMILVFLAFSMFFSIESADFGTRYFFMVLPFFSIILADSKNKHALKYLAVCVVALLAISSVLQIFMVEKEAGMLSSLNAIHDKYAGKEIYATEDDIETRFVERLFYGRTLQTANQTGCTANESIGPIDVCVNELGAVIGREVLQAGDLPFKYSVIK